MDRKIRTYSNLAQPVSHQGGDQIYNCRMGGLSNKPYL